MSTRWASITRSGVGCYGFVPTCEQAFTCVFVCGSTVCGLRTNGAKLICVSMLVCVHSCTLSGAHTERFNEDDSTECRKHR